MNTKTANKKKLKNIIEIMKQKILITGVPGNVGSKLVEQIKNEQCPFRIGAYEPKKVEKIHGQDLDTVYFDFTDPSTYEPALKGVTKIFLIRPPALTDYKEDFQPFLSYAKEKGVEHVVFLSIIGINIITQFIFPHGRIERGIKKLGLNYTFLRSSFFMQNLLRRDNYMRQDIKRYNSIRVPAGKGETSFVDTRDIAAVAIECFKNKEHYNQVYELTGKEELSYYEVADILSEVLGRNIKYTDPSRSEFFEQKKEQGLNEDFISVMANLFFLTKLRRANKVTNDVKKLLSRDPISMRQFVEDQKDLWM